MKMMAIGVLGLAAYFVLGRKTDKEKGGTGTDPVTGKGTNSKNKPPPTTKVPPGLVPLTMAEMPAWVMGASPRVLVLNAAWQPMDLAPYAAWGASHPQIPVGYLEATKSEVDLLIEHLGIYVLPQTGVLQGGAMLGAQQGQLNENEIQALWESAQPVSMPFSG